MSTDLDVLYVLSEFLHHATETPLSSPDTNPNCIISKRNGNKHSIMK